MEVIFELMLKFEILLLLLFLDADSFEPKEIKAAPVGANKWEGEDEDEDVKVRGNNSSYICIRLIIYKVEYTC